MGLRWEKQLQLVYTFAGSGFVRLWDEGCSKPELSAAPRLRLVVNGFGPLASKYHGATTFSADFANLRLRRPEERRDVLSLPAFPPVPHPAANQTHPYFIGDPCQGQVWRGWREDNSGINGGLQRPSFIRSQGDSGRCQRGRLRICSLFWYLARARMTTYWKFSRNHLYFTLH